MRMSRILGLIGGGEAPFDASSYTFTGHAQLTTDADGNWELQLKTSGTLTFNRKKKFAIDVFCAGGGGGGASTTLANYGSGGGGGGMYYGLTNVGKGGSGIAVIRNHR